MNWRDDWLRKRVQGFRDHVAELDEAERQARRNAPSQLGPARKRIPEGPGTRAARERNDRVKRVHDDASNTEG